MRNLIWVIFLLFVVIPAFSQDSVGYLVISDIRLEGLKKTKESLILRELTIRKNDSIDLKILSEKIKESKERLVRLGIFEKVDINLKDWNTDTKNAILLVQIKEAYQTIIYPYLELADRNFNIWWVEQKRDLSRISGGMSAYFLNFTGHLDRLRILGQIGFTDKIYTEYILPSINKKKTLGLKAKLMYSSANEVWYKTENDKLLKKQFKTPAFKQFFVQGGLTWRPKLFSQHTFEIGWYSNSVIDSIATDYNPLFLGNGQKKQQYPMLQYTFSIDQRNIRAFPTKGFFTELVLKKEGLFEPSSLVNTAFSTLDMRYYLPIIKNMTLGLHSKSKLSFIRKQPPYFNSRTLGYRPDYMRGYEYYVVEGIDFSYLKSTLFYCVFDKSLHLGKWMPFKSFRQLPVAIYPSINFDLGYVNSIQNDLSNKMTNRFLYSTGIGVNILAYHTRLLQIEFSMNHLQEKGVFLHYDLDF